METGATSYGSRLQEVLRCSGDRRPLMAFTAAPSGAPDAVATIAAVIREDTARWSAAARRARVEALEAQGPSDPADG